MTLLETLLERYPGIDDNPQRGDSLASLVGEVGSTVGLAEIAVKTFSSPFEIRQFYNEYIDFILKKYDVINLEAEQHANEMLGLATAVFPENREVWFNTLEYISHPIFGRNTYPPNGEVITEVELTLSDPSILSNFECQLNDMEPTPILGEISYQKISENPAILKLYFSDRVSRTEHHIAYLAGILGGIKSEVTIKTGKLFSFNFKWSAEKISADKEDIQSYWEKELNYIRKGDSWFRKGLRKKQVETEAWFEEAYIGQYPTACMDGTPAPYGLHLTFNLDEDSVGTGIGTQVGWCFVGNQIDDYLKASGVNKPEELKGKKVKIYEIGMMIVGVEAYKGEK